MPDITAASWLLEPFLRGGGGALVITIIFIILHCKLLQHIYKLVLFLWFQEFMLILGIGGLVEARFITDDSFDYIRYVLH